MGLLKLQGVPDQNLQLQMAFPQNLCMLDPKLKGTFSLKRRKRFRDFSTEHKLRRALFWNSSNLAPLPKNNQNSGA